jgi:hypothetical protein
VHGRAATKEGSFAALVPRGANGILARRINGEAKSPVHREERLYV